MQQVATSENDGGTVLQDELITTLQTQLDDAKQREKNQQDHIDRLTNILENQQRLLTSGQPRPGLWQRVSEWFGKATQPPPDN